jgi:hypothetical protein
MLKKNIGTNFNEAHNSIIDETMYVFKKSYFRSDIVEHVSIQLHQKDPTII